MHLLHTTNARTLAQVRWAKEAGQDVTAELNPHCLFLGGSWENIERLGPYALGVWVSDPHVEALWEAARDGGIDIIIPTTLRMPAMRGARMEGHVCGPGRKPCHPGVPLPVPH